MRTHSNRSRSGDVPTNLSCGKGSTCPWQGISKCPMPAGMAGHDRVNTIVITSCPETSALITLIFILFWPEMNARNGLQMTPLFSNSSTVFDLDFPSDRKPHQLTWACLTYLFHYVNFGGGVASLHQMTLDFYITGRLGLSRLYQSFCKISCFTWEILSCLLLTHLHLFHDPVVLCGDFVVSLEILGWGTGAWHGRLRSCKLCQHYFRILIQRVRISWEISKANLPFSCLCNSLFAMVV